MNAINVINIAMMYIAATAFLLAKIEQEKIWVKCAAAQNMDKFCKNLD